MTAARRPKTVTAPDVVTSRRVGQHEWRRAIRGQMPATTFAVAQAVASYTNKDGGKAYPGNERLAADLCCTTKTVQRALKWLRTEGWLQLDQPAGLPNQSRKLAQEWSLTIPDRWTSTTELVDSGVHPPDPSSHQSSSLKLAQSPIEPDRHKLNINHPEYDGDFAEEWIEEACGPSEYEMSTVYGMLANGIHPYAIANTVEASRR